MPGYRVEISPNNRAVCKNTECKKAGVKITKGELRFGTLVTIHDHTSFTYKHWGCVTPAQIEHLQEFIEGDLDLVDGLDELDTEHQEKVKYALEHGHVHDEDWKGDVEVNRPGEKGYRVKGKATKKNGKKTADTGEDEGAAKPRKKRGRAALDDDDDNVPAPPPKKTKAKATEVAAPKPARGGKKTAAAETEETPAKPTRGRKKTTAVETEEAPAKPTRGRKKTTADEPDQPPPKPARGRKAAAAATDKADPAPTRGKKATATGDDKVAPQKRGRKKKTADE